MVVITELETLMMDILNPVRLISISPVNTFDFQLNYLFWISRLLIGFDKDKDKLICGLTKTGY